MVLVTEDKAVKQKYRMGDQLLDLYVVSGEIFHPNQTSETVYTSVDVYEGDIGIEIGSGIGPGTVFLAQKPLSHLYSVEIVPMQIDLQKRNIESYGLSDKVSVLQGSLFEPIRNLNPRIRADFIVSDVSGMNDVGVELGWYPPCVPRGGEDGTENIIPFLEQAEDLLNLRNEKAKVYFPIVVNFSDGNKILDKARENYSKLEKINEKRIPLRQEQLDVISNSAHPLFEPIDRKGSRGFWKVEIYRAMEPKF